MLTGGPGARGLSLRGNFAWNLTGEAAFSLAQWVLLVLLARLESPRVVGEFAFALALTAPVYLFVGLNLRVVQATDASRRWWLDDYVRLRYGLNAVAFCASVVLGAVAGLRGTDLAVIAAVAAAKATEATSQTFYGYFQRRERMDLVARSLLLRAGLATTAFAVVLGVLPGLLPATLALWAGRLLAAVLHDRRIALAMWRTERRAIQPQPGRPMARDRLLTLGRTALPLGVSAGVSSLTINVPRYLLVGVVGSAALGVYAALAYLAQVVVLVTGAMGNAVVPRLSQYHEEGRTKDFVRLVAQLTGLGAAMTVCVLVVLAVGGEWLIGSVLGQDFVDQPLLLALILGAGLATLQRSMGRGLQAAHRFLPFLYVDVLTLVVVVATGPWLVREHGAEGAAWSLNIALASATLVTALLLSQTASRLRAAGLAEDRSG